MAKYWFISINLVVIVSIGMELVDSQNLDIYFWVINVYDVVQHGACVNVADLWKFTPLHEAAAKGKFEICRLLLKVMYNWTSSEAAVQCIVIGPVCLWVCVFVGLLPW